MPMEHYMAAARTNNEWMVAACSAEAVTRSDWTRPEPQVVVVKWSIPVTLPQSRGRIWGVFFHVTRRFRNHNEKCQRKRLPTCRRLEPQQTLGAEWLAASLALTSDLCYIKFLNHTLSCRSCRSRTYKANCTKNSAVKTSVLHSGRIIPTMKCKWQGQAGAGVRTQLTTELKGRSVSR